MNHRFQQFQKDGHLSGFDLRMAAFLCRLSAIREPSFFLAAALVSRAAAHGDVCLDLARLAGRPWPPEAPPEAAIQCPPREEWCRTVAAAKAVGRPGERRPLILDHAARLYFYRYWEHERTIGSAIAARTRRPVEGIDMARLEAGLKRLFPSLAGGEPDWQAAACVAAVLHRFAVICGGPGTGKTSTVAKVLSLLLELSGERPPRISLCAPTGKAAARLTASIQAVKAQLPCSDRVRALIPEQATTVHRLLKAVPGSSTYRHHRRNPLPCDVVVVDEASMVDMALMSHLVQALAPEARLLLVGDRDQLASVEAGSVLGDICHKRRSLEFSAEFSARLASLAGTRPDAILADLPESGGAARLADSIVVLRRSYRFEDDGGIGLLARRVNAGDVEGVFEILSDSAEACVRWQAGESDAAMRTWLAKQAVKGYRDYLSTREPHQAMQRFDRFRILCAVRGGPFGVDAVNGLARRALAGAGLLMPERAGADPGYAGRPVLITQNDYESGLYNGDLGVTLPDPAADRLVVFFRGPAGDPRPFDPLQLPAHETVFAMTVHKSQGSECEEVLLVLPERDTPLLTRELVYTAVTRARRSVTIAGRRAVLSAALGRTIDRASGLQERLWGMDSEAQEAMQ